jgi:Ca-activated chloride channel homolog
MLYNYLDKYHFEHVWLLWFLLLLPLIVILTYKKKKAHLKVSNVAHYYQEGKKKLFFGIPKFLQLLSLGFTIVALAQPRSYKNLDVNNTEGIDIVICVDISGSMNAMDLTPDRLEAAKEVAINFVNNRVSDRIGFVTFSAEAFTNCPITNNYDFLLKSIYETKSGMLKDGTHIGEGLGTAVSGLEKSKAKSKIVILLTDGINDPNAQDVSPESAKELAKKFKIKVYTIGVGTMGSAPTPSLDAAGNRTIINSPVKIDEGLLKNIAKETGGKYYRATDNESLKNIYAEIDKLEKVKIDATNFSKYTEHFQPFILIAISALFLSLLLSYTVHRVFP